MRHLFFLLPIFFSLYSYGQEKCGTVKWEELNGRDADYRIEFEKWLEGRQKQWEGRIKTREIYQIPVVFHIIHQGEPYGEGSNIPDEQIYSQLETLNADFKRLNADTLNTPEVFMPDAANTRIEFILAKQDPEGLPTTGINRVQGSKSNWSISDFAIISAQSYWPSKYYLNIWVGDLAGEVIGWAQLPTSGLGGLDPSPRSEFTDGVVVDFEYFGTSFNAEPFSQGRTTTHEVGHYLGLRHIWGDSNNCEEDDFVDDTPEASSSTFGCPSNKSTCGTRDMFENYMDYTDDVCMNMFTNGQRDRMHTILENSPRRISLLTSPGLNEPEQYALDLGIRTIFSPQQGSCDTVVNPVIQVRNYGSDAIDEYEISIFLNDSLIESVTQSVSLSQYELSLTSFSQLNLQKTGVNEFKAVISLINGDSTDENSSNNADSLEVVVVPQGEIPVIEDFENGIGEEWSVINVDNNITWQVRPVVEDQVENQVLMYNTWDYDFLNEEDFLISPTVDISSFDSVILKFRVSHALFPGNFDGLRIVVSEDCGNSFAIGNTIYDKIGPELSTTETKTSEFFPSTRFDWRTEIVDLSDYIPNGDITLSFIGYNGFGNNIFLDDIQILGFNESPVNLQLTSLELEPLITCDEPYMNVVLQNKSTSYVIDTVYLVTRLNNLRIYDTLTGLNLQPSEIYTFSKPYAGSDNRINISVTGYLPASAGELTSEDNQLSGYVERNTESSIFPPDRYQFSDNSFNNWSVINLYDETRWDLSSRSSRALTRGSLRLNYFNNDAIGNQDYLVSPVINAEDTLSMFFDISYGSNQNFTDSLKIIGWDGCLFDNPVILYNKGGEELAVRPSNELWQPLDTSYWRREYVDLSPLLALENPRVAFVATSGYGNDMYLDGIEFFLGNNPSPVIPEPNEILIYPNPTYDNTLFISFNTNKKQDAQIKIIDSSGRAKGSYSFPNTLNQSYRLDVTGLEPGMYLIFIQTEGGSLVKRFQRY